MQALVLIYHLSITYKTYKTYSTIQNINNINMSSTSTSTTSLDTYNSTHTMNYHHHYQPTNNELIQQAVPTEVKKLVSLTWQMVSCLCCNICVLQNSWLIVAVVLLLLLMLLILLMFLLLLMMFYCCWCFCCFLLLLMLPLLLLWLLSSCDDVHLWPSYNNTVKEVGSH